MKEVIATTNAPGAIGPYSQATKAGSLVFVSGQLPIDPATGVMPEDVSRRQSSRSQTARPSWKLPAAPWRTL